MVFVPSSYCELGEDRELGKHGQLPLPNCPGVNIGIGRCQNAHPRRKVYQGGPASSSPFRDQLASCPLPGFFKERGRESLTPLAVLSDTLFAEKGLGSLQREGLSQVGYAVMLTPISFYFILGERP